MGIIGEYSSTSVRLGGHIDLSKLDGTKGYLRHYQNLLVLTFFHQHGTRLERQQAAEEMIVCERKLKWWSNLPSYDHAAALKGVETLKREWIEKAA